MYGYPVLRQQCMHEGIISNKSLVENILNNSEHFEATGPDKFLFIHPKYSHYLKVITLSLSADSCNHRSSPPSIVFATQILLLPSLMLFFPVWDKHVADNLNLLLLG